MKMIEEFKAFAMRGNVVDLAFGVIIGAAFGKIVSALVSDVIMPPIGRLVGNLDFSNLYLSLSEKVTQAQTTYAADPKTLGAHLPLDLAQKAGPVLAWGDFVSVTLNFVIVALVLFIFIVKFLGWIMRTKKEAPPPSLTKDQELLVEIRDLLKNQRT